MKNAIKSIAEAYAMGKRANMNGRPFYAVPNPYSVNGVMPTDLSQRIVKWCAFQAGVLRAAGDIKGAGTMHRNAMFYARKLLDEMA